jgi:hypothetical protein
MATLVLKKHGRMVTMVKKGHGKNCGHGAKKVDNMAVMVQKER